MAESKLLGALVATLPIHEGLRPQVVQRLLKHGRVSLCQEGQVLYAAGSPARQVYVVVWGKAEIREKDGQVFYARRGDLLGTEAAEENGVYRADVKISAKSVLLTIRADDFKAYFLKYQPVAAWVLRKIGEQFRKESGMGGEGLDELDPALWLAELEEDKRRAMKEEP
jgi:signal-transduction protein with cAMP-binding, CBS, and nucleotidyltransferase domain